MQDQIIIQSPERIVHFQCPVCEGWWSVGDAPERTHWFCTWCGKRALTKGDTVLVAMELIEEVERLRAEVDAYERYTSGQITLKQLGQAIIAANFLGGES